MHTNDKSGIDLRDVPAAVGLLTRLPVPVDTDNAMARGAAAAWAYPVAGAVVAVLATMAAWGALALGLGSAIAALLAVGVGVVVTGAMHEDGLADCVDGFWGGYTPERRLEIMKDSQIGTYGVVALGIVLALRVAAVMVLIDNGALLGGLVATAMLSRAGMVAVMETLPHARPDGLSAKVGQPGMATVQIAASLAIVIAVIAVGWSAVGMTLAVLGACWGVARVALAKIDGQTGDVLGATQQLSEIAGLLALVALTT